MGGAGTNSVTTYNTIFADIHNNTSAASTNASTTQVAGATQVAANDELITVATAGANAAGGSVTTYSLHGLLSNGNYFCIDSTGNTNPAETAAHAKGNNITCN